MSDAKKTLPDLISNSALPNDDKKMFIALLEKTSEEDVVETIKAFTTDPREIVIFWTILKAKLSLLSIIESDDDFSFEDKMKITNQIIAMNEEEFSAFVDGIGQASDSKNPDETLQKLIYEQKETHKEFMSQSKDFLKKLRESHKKLQGDKDKDNYEDALAKINSLKS